MRADQAPAAPGTMTRGPATSRREALLVAGVALAAGIAVSLLALGLTGGLSPDEGPFDSGALVRYGLPIAKTVRDVAAAATVGFLITATWIVSARPSTDPDSLGGARRPLARAAIAASVSWGLAAIVTIVLTAADVSGFPVGTPGFASVVVSFVGQIDLGRELGASLLAVIVTANLAILATRLTTLAWAAVFSVIALLPLALTGHAAGARDHMNAVDSLAFHLVGVCLWAGGLAALLLVAGRLGDQLPTAARRYSTLAGWCFLTVALSGIVNAALRLGSIAGLATPYGLLIVGKALALGALGLAGLAHRRFTLKRLDRARSEGGRIEHEGHWFARLATVELIVMGGTMGLAVALAQSAPPVPDEPLDPVSSLLGYPAPPPLTTWTYFTEFYPDLLWLTVAVVFAGCYLAGAIRLWRRGDAWSKPRTASWLVGCLVLVAVTSGGIGVYGRLHFSTHMLQHMLLMIVVPFFWVIGAPITLALRALRSRTDASLGPRETLLRIVHSRVLRVLGHPLFSEAFFIVSLIAFYYSFLFSLAMFTHGGHVLMTAHFLLVGYLFIWSLIGTDPGPARPPYAFRLVLLLMAMGFHAIFGITLMSSGALLAPDWWHALGYTDDAALVADQQKGGGIAWGAGDLPSFVLAIALLVVWFSSDQRESRRRDRQADRDGDAELKSYNERLAAMHRRDTGGSDGS
ncbi:cytochrome c oxidase assembly protein [Microlunatus ginsengisoli]|uniref:Cytochrome c oxidase assembly protein n=1 Tax=Microlunatus ginsengisoli TaxID=363863 RepID=A0ABP7A1A6_9ACTN